MGKVMPDYDRLITCMSASKTFNLAGLMHSNIIIRDAEERARFQDRDKNIGAVNPLSIAAHKAAYEHGGPWLEQLKAYVDGNLALVDQFLKENIPGAKFTIPESTYFAWVDLREVLPEVEDLAGLLCQQGRCAAGGRRRPVRGQRQGAYPPEFGHAPCHSADRSGAYRRGHPQGEGRRITPRPHE